MARKVLAGGVRARIFRLFTARLLTHRSIDMARNANTVSTMAVSSTALAVVAGQVRDPFSRYQARSRADPGLVWIRSATWRSSSNASSSRYGPTDQVVRVRTLGQALQRLAGNELLRDLHAIAMIAVLGHRLSLSKFGQTGSISFPPIPKDAPHTQPAHSAGRFGPESCCDYFAFIVDNFSPQMLTVRTWPKQGTGRKVPPAGGESLRGALR